MARIRHVRIEGGLLRFSGDCDACLPSCLASCCRSMRAPLAAEELASGRYLHERVEGVDVLRHDEAGCVYLKDARCSIYAERPAACRHFDCSGHRWKLFPVTAPRMNEPGLPPVLEQDGRVYHYRRPSAGKLSRSGSPRARRSAPGPGP